MTALGIAGRRGPGGEDAGEIERVDAVEAHDLAGALLLPRTAKSLDGSGHGVLLTDVA
jgi:hypothetical protein